MIKYTSDQKEIEREEYKKLYLLCMQTDPLAFGNNTQRFHTFNDIHRKTKLYEPNGQHFFALQKQKIVGYMRVKITQPIGYFFALYVDPKYRGKGIGTSLINQAVNYTKERGCTIATLTVGNMQYAALSLYKKHGFEIQSEKLFKHYRPNKKDTEGIICLTKHLNKI